MECLLHNRKHPMYLRATWHSRKAFPFECPKGRQFLENHPLLGAFHDFGVKNPENLLACHRLELIDVRFPITPRFMRHLDSFRGSMKVLIVQSLMPSRNPRAHLDRFHVRLCFQGNGYVEFNLTTLRSLAGVSCNVFEWSADSEVALAYTHELVKRGESRFILHLGYESSQAITAEEIECDATRAFELTHNDGVKELHWRFMSSKSYDSLPMCFETGLRGMGKLDSFSFCLGEKIDVDFLDQVLEALSPPVAPKLCIDFGDYKGEKATDKFNSSLCCYVRKYKSLEKLEFSLMDDYTDEIYDNLEQLTFDNRWYRHIRKPIISLAYVLRGRAIRRPAVLFFALKYKVSELVDHL